MRKQALSLIGTFAVVIAASIGASATLLTVNSVNNISQGRGARLSSTKEGHQLDRGRAASAKPLNNVTGTPCDSYYNMYGGSRAQFRGRYNKGPASMTCHGNAVYIQSDTSCSGCPHYLIYTGHSWLVTSQDVMKACGTSGTVPSANDCTCPQDCTDPCTGCGSFGAWQENTGRNGNGGGATCNEDAWCDSGIWWV